MKNETRLRQFFSGRKFHHVSWAFDRSIMRANPQALIQHLVLIHVFCIFPDAKNPSIAKVRYAVN